VQVVAVVHTRLVVQVQQVAVMVTLVVLVVLLLQTVALVAVEVDKQKVVLVAQEL
jgi:hypothetical protein